MKPSWWCRGPKRQRWIGQVRLLFHMVRTGKLEQELFVLLHWFEPFASDLDQTWRGGGYHA